jgi:hypothetical protein
VNIVQEWWQLVLQGQVPYLALVALLVSGVEIIPDTLASPLATFTGVDKLFGTDSTDSAGSELK